MGSFKMRIKYFIINQCLARMPGWFLYFLYSKIMLPKAQSDIEAVRSLYMKDFMQQAHRIKGLQVYRRTAMPLIVGMIGLPQEGKSIFSYAVASEGGLFRIDSNLVRNWLIDMGKDYRNIDAIILYMMEEALKDWFNPVLDGDSIFPGKRAFIMAIAEKHRANVEYVRVSTPFEKWKSRLDFTIFRLNRMYIDGIKRSYKMFADGQTKIPPEYLRKLVDQEYNRQLQDHVRYLGSVNFFSSVLNTGNEEDLKGRGRFTARELLSIYGDGKTRREIEERFGVVDARRKK